jgi:hypothetical protein
MKRLTSPRSPDRLVILYAFFARRWPRGDRGASILDHMIKRITPILIAAGALALPSAASAAAFEGTVVSVKSGNHSFRLSDSERGTKRFYVKSSTDFERISGFGALKAGQKNIEVTAHRRDGKWVADVVERSGGGGGHGGDDA